MFNNTKFFLASKDADDQRKVADGQRKSLRGTTSRSREFEKAAVHMIK